MRLPSAEHAVVDPAKIRDYLLSPEHPVGRAKARFFAALGFHRADCVALHHALLVHAAAGEAEPGSVTPYGRKYTVRGILQGADGRSAPVVSIWIILAGEHVPRLVTAYPE